MPLYSKPYNRSGRSCWFYGRSGAGKTTLATLIADRLIEAGHQVFKVDGDRLRSGLCRDLGFDEPGRTENHRRAAELAKLAMHQGFIVIGATMCPLPAHRLLLREMLGDQLHLVYLDATHEACAQRDPKGLYRRSVAGKIDHFDKEFFQEPLAIEYDMRIHTGSKSLEDCTREAENYINSCLRLSEVDESSSSIRIDSTGQ